MKARHLLLKTRNIINLLSKKLLKNWNINQLHFDLARLSRMCIKARYDSGYPQIIPTKADDGSFSLACEIFKMLRTD